ncbi:hypothetical protein [Kaarinaea lacus]
MQAIEINAGKESIHGVPNTMKHVIYAIGLNIKEQVLATHKELKILRRCAKILQEKPNASVQIVCNKQNHKSQFLAKTFIHLGVSCGKISVKESAPLSASNGMWLLISEA